MITKFKVRSPREVFLQAVQDETQRTGIGRRRLYAAMSPEFQDAVKYDTYCDWISGEWDIPTVPAKPARQVLALYKKMPGLLKPVSLREAFDYARFNGKDVLLVDRRIAYAQVAGFLKSGGGKIQTSELWRKVHDKFPKDISVKDFDAVTQPGGGAGRGDRHLNVHRNTVAGIMLVMRDEYGIPFGPTYLELVRRPKPEK